MDRLFNPRSIAVVGATPKDGKIGNTLLKNLMHFEGDVYAVNPKYDEVLGFRCYPSIESIPEEVDLAVVAVPYNYVLDVLRGCVKKNVKNVVVISAGFKEAGRFDLENELKYICRKHGINLVGPNCLGIMNAHINLNATFSRIFPSKGDIAFLSQSGAFILAVLEWARETDVGFSKVVSLGNKAVLDESDFICYLAEDDQTEVIMLYVEGIEDGRKFVNTVKSIDKPIVVFKCGRTDAGARAVSGHTGSLAGSYTVYKTVFRQLGIVEANTIEEFFDFSLILRRIRRIDGGIAIITNSGGPGVAAADAVEELEMDLARFDGKTIESLKSILPPIANIYNPVDILGDSDADRFGNVFNVVIDDGNVGAVVAILTPTAQMDFEKAANLITTKKPVVTCFMGGESVKDAVKILREKGIINFLDPYRAVKSLKAVKTYELRKKVEKTFKRFRVDMERLREIIEGIGDKRFIGFEGFRILECYGISVPPYGIARSAEEALKVADEIGYPVAMKVISPDIIHKTDVGCVELNVKREKVIPTFNRLVKIAEDFLNAEVEGILIQKMISRGREVVIGVKKDPQFGHIAMFGFGGIYVEVFRDVSFRLLPLSEEEAFDMIREVKVYRILKGVRGEKPYDIKGVVDLILRVSQMSQDLDLLEVDLNPVFVYERGYYVVDCKIMR